MFHVKHSGELQVSGQPLLNRLALQFLQGVPGYPSGAGGILFQDLPGGLYGPPVKRGVALADLAQGPVNGLSDKVPVIVGRTGYKGGEGPRKPRQAPFLSWTERATISTKPARFTNSSFRPVHAMIFSPA